MLPELEREKIVVASIILFSRYGLDHVDFREIAFDSGIALEKLKSQFKTKEEILDEILEYIPRYFEHYDPSEEDIDELLERETAEEILTRFVDYYNLDEDYLLSCIYRFIYMEQCRNKKVSTFAYYHFVKPPMANAMKIIDYLAQKGALPQGDSRAIAEMWNRTSLMFGMMKMHDKSLISPEEYDLMTKFFIRMASRGVKVIPVDDIDISWNSRVYLEDFDTEHPTAKQEILLKALDLFSENGYANVSMHDIARASKMRLSTVYGKFRSKSDIMKEIVNTIMNFSNQGNSPFSAVKKENNPEQIILNMADCYSPIKDELALKLYRVLYREQFFNEDLKDFLVGNLFMDVDAISKWLDRLKQEKSIRECDSRKVALAYVYAMCSFTIGAVAVSDHIEDLDQIRLRVIALLVSFVLNGYTLDA